MTGLAVVADFASPLLTKALKDGTLEGISSTADLSTAAVDLLLARADLKVEKKRGGRAAIDPGEGVRRADVNRVFTYVRQVLRSSLVDLQSRTLDEGFISSAEELLKKAAGEKWGRERFIAEVGRLAESYGATNFRTSYAATWYRTIILNASYNRALLVAYNSEPTSRLYPFLAIRTVDDEVRRPEHGAMDGFVARTNWKGWRKYLPPYGWNCRCRAVPVSYLIARELGWIGEDFPRGDHFLQPRTVNGKRITPGRSPGFVEPFSLLPEMLPHN